MEVSGRQLGRARLEGQIHQRTDLGLLNHRSTGGLPLSEALPRFVVGDGGRFAARFDG